MSVVRGTITFFIYILKMSNISSKVWNSTAINASGVVLLATAVVKIKSRNGTWILNRFKNAYNFFLAHQFQLRRIRAPSSVYSLGDVQFAIMLFCMPYHEINQFRFFHQHHVVDGSVKHLISRPRVPHTAKSRSTNRSQNFLCASLWSPDQGGWAPTA